MVRRRLRGNVVAAKTYVATSWGVAEKDVFFFDVGLGETASMVVERVRAVVQQGRPLRELVGVVSYV